MSVFYNEIEPYAAQWLRNLIREGLIPDGEVCTTSIVDLRPSDLAGFIQCHFFAGIGGWSHALRLAGWPDDRPIWTGSCPCQPFSAAGKGLGFDDPRHLWPHFFRLIRECRPPVVMGEQVAGAAGYGWLDGVRADLASENYACGAVDVPACSVGAPHIRQRLYWVADDVAHPDDAQRRQDGARGHDDDRAQAGRVKDASHAGACDAGDVADAKGVRRKEWKWQDGQQDAGSGGESGMDVAGVNSFWSDAIWLVGADGKARRAQPALPLLAHGIPNRVGRLRAYGNAIVPQVAEQVIRAYMEA